MQTLSLQTGKTLLPQLAVLEITGDDRLQFVHGQLTNHVLNIAGAFRLAAYCTPQGRIQASMRLFAQDDKLFMIVARDLLEGFKKRFSMFILRSKVAIREADELVVAGLINPTSVTLPEVDTIAFTQDLALGRVADASIQRGYVVATREAFDALAENEIGQEYWWAAETAAGLPWVTLATKEAFIPQWINFDRVGGVVFNKGCYPGQEVIARMQHIGTTPRRTVLAMAEATVTVANGTDVTIEGDSMGTVVQSSTVNGQTWALVQMPVKLIEAAPALVIDGTTFTIQAHPYTFQ